MDNFLKFKDKRENRIFIKNSNFYCYNWDLFSVLENSEWESFWARLRNELTPCYNLFKLCECITKWHLKVQSLVDVYLSQGSYMNDSELKLKWFLNLQKMKETHVYDKVSDSYISCSSYLAKEISIFPVLLNSIELLCKGVISEEKFLEVLSNINFDNIKNKLSTFCKKLDKLIVESTFEHKIEGKLKKI